MGNRFLPPLLLAPLSIAACAPCAPAIQVGAKSIPADGVSEVLVTILTGRQCADEYSLTTDLGHLSSGVGKTPYRTEYSLRSGNVPGTATVTIQGFAISDAIEFEAPAAIGAQLHLHGPISEGDGTHAWQVDEAQAWNVPVLWWTDHDYRYWYDWYETPEWSVGTPLSTSTNGDGTRQSWWQTQADESASVSAYLDDSVLVNDEPSLVVTAEVSADAASDWTPASIEWKTTGRRNYRPLLADVSVQFSVKVSAEFDGSRERVRVNLPLSRIDPQNIRSILVLDDGDDGPIPVGSVPVVTSWVPDEWVDVSLNLGSILTATHPDEEAEHSLRGLQLQLEAAPGSTVSARFGGLIVSSQYEGDELSKLQQEFLEEAFPETTNFVGQEVSYDTTDVLHFNAYGSSVPWMDYGRFDLKTQASKIVDDIHAHGGIAAFNHPFGVFLGLGDYDNPNSLIQSTCDWLDRESIYGADLIEIGYPQRELPFSAHLALWDCLAKRGHAVTAIGTSDQHVTQYWDQYLNNFVTWILSPTASEDNLLNALASGRAFFGNPTLSFSSRPFVDLRVHGKGAMGQVVTGLSGDELSVEAVLSGLDLEDQVHWIVDGELADARTNLAANERLSINVTPGSWSYVRIEVYTKSGEAKLFSNPIYLSTLEPDVAPSRRPNP